MSRVAALRVDQRPFGYVPIACVDRKQALFIDKTVVLLAHGLIIFSDFIRS